MVIRADLKILILAASVRSTELHFRFALASLLLCSRFVIASLLLCFRFVIATVLMVAHSVLAPRDFCGQILPWGRHPSRVSRVTAGRPLQSPQALL